ncbi:MAG: sulfite exporter TauE/SafE family protein [Desulfovibrio sp.]|nr:sulfite exporter TauE/SafE family protein [Desulfovibrio sp.]
MYFPVAGVEAAPAWPPAWAFGISFFCSMSGISGAFLLLPYQISILGYVLPGVSATNQIFNILACPAGVWRYAREGRLLLPLALIIAAGTLPGVFIGALLRLTVLATARVFLFFVAAVLLYLGLRILLQKGSSRANAEMGVCKVLSKGLSGFDFSFANQAYSVNSLKLMLLSLAVGIIGGIYGIGGGAIMVPFLVSFFGLPVYAIAGASLFATFLTSIAGVGFYSLLSWLWAYPWAAPDWGLGLLLGLGGIFGMYCGSACQKYVPPHILRFLLLVIIFFMATHYLLKALGY